MFVATVGKEVGIKMTYEPSKQDNDFLNQVDQGYIGLDKPKIEYSKEPDPDPNYYFRRAAARKLGMDEEELADEPDIMSDHSDEQGWQ